jgi:hypothetical protein
VKLPFVIISRKRFEAMERRITTADKKAAAQRQRRANPPVDKRQGQLPIEPGVES